MDNLSSAGHAADIFTTSRVAASCCFTNASPRCSFKHFSCVIAVSHLSSRVISFPLWQPNSPLSAQQSSFTPAGSQPHPYPPSGHLPPILLAVKPSPLRPAVILHSCWQPTSPSPRRQETGDGIRDIYVGCRA